MSTTPDNVVKLEVPAFDIRIVDQNLSSGLVTDKEYKKYLASLKDLTDESEEIVIDFEGDEDEAKEAPSDDDESSDS